MACRPRHEVVAASWIPSHHTRPCFQQYQTDDENEGLVLMLLYKSMGVQPSRVIQLVAHTRRRMQIHQHQVVVGVVRAPSIAKHREIITKRAHIRQYYNGVDPDRRLHQR
jgi:hypothetical protein